MAAVVKDDLLYGYSRDILNMSNGKGFTQLWIKVERGPGSMCPAGPQESIN